MYASNWRNKHDTMGCIAGIDLESVGAWVYVECAWRPDDNGQQ